MRFFLGFLLSLGLFHSILVGAKESELSEMEAALRSAGKSYLQFVVEKSGQQLQEKRNESPPATVKGKGRYSKDFPQQHDLATTLRDAISLESISGGNNITWKFLTEMRGLALSTLENEYLSPEEGAVLVYDIYSFLEELPGSKMSRNSFYLDAADAIRKNQNSHMNAESKELILSKVLVKISKDRVGPMSLRELFGTLDFLDSELRNGNSDQFVFLANQLIDNLLENTYEWVAIAKGPETGSPYLKFDIARARVHLILLIANLLPKVSDVKKRNELEQALKDLRIKLAESERIFEARQRQGNKIKTCRNRLTPAPRK